MVKLILKKFIIITSIFLFFDSIILKNSYTQNYNSQQSTKDTVQLEWVRQYIGPDSTWDNGVDIAVDKQSNVYVTGNSGDRMWGPHYCATLKYNSNGELQWTALYDGADIYGADAVALALDTNNNVYVSSVSYSATTGSDYAAVKYNSEGVQKWESIYNGPDSSAERPRDLAVDDSGNVFVTGYSIGDTTSDDYATVKYNKKGFERWVRRYNGPFNSSDFGREISNDDSGNVYVTGYGDGGISGNDFVTVKYNSNGVEKWVSRYSDHDYNSDAANDIAVDDSGNVYVTGSSEGIGTGRDFATVKYNSLGVEKWVKRYTSPGQVDDASKFISLDKLGNIYISGYSWGAGGKQYFTVIKYNSDGVEQWVNNNITGGPLGMQVDDEGNVYVTGSDWGGSSAMDMVTIKYDTDGVVQWIETYNGSFNFDDGANALAIDDSGNVYIAGYSYIDWYQPTMTTIKYSQSPLSSVQNEKEIKPKNYRLYQNYPNPFNNSTQINYSLPYTGYVNLKIYDVLGREVGILVNKKQPAGTYSINYKASSQSSGIYFYQLTVYSSTTNYQETKKMLLLN